MDDGGKVFFIADTHFGEENIIRFENRPFADAEEMDAALVSAWNGVVAPEDTVWHLGDFGACGQEEMLLSKLNGRKMLVKGNHDTMSNEHYRRAGFTEVYDRPVLLDGFWILSHEPLYVSVNMPYANLFGHVHANPIFRDFSPHHFCVCVERTSYAPIEFSRIKAGTSSKTQ